MNIKENVFVSFTHFDIRHISVLTNEISIEEHIGWIGCDKIINYIGPLKASELYTRTIQFVIQR